MTLSLYNRSNLLRGNRKLKHHHFEEFRLKPQWSSVRAETEVSGSWKGNLEGRGMLSRVIREKKNQRSKQKLNPINQSQQKQGILKLKDIETIPNQLLVN